MRSFLFKAQDKNMLGGDFALFAFSDLATDSTLQPWLAYNVTNETGTHRMDAFRALKLVRFVYIHSLQHQPFDPLQVAENGRAYVAVKGIVMRDVSSTASRAICTNLAPPDA